MEGLWRADVRFDIPAMDVAQTTYVSDGTLCERFGADFVAHGRRLEAPLPPGHADSGARLKSRVEIHYCTQCRWLLRAAWTAQELLTTFEEELGEVALVPGTGGVFEVRADGQLLWSRQERGRFPELRELKQLLRDRVAPGRDLGHSDRG